MTDDEIAEHDARLAHLDAAGDEQFATFLTTQNAELREAAMDKFDAAFAAVFGRTGER
jgi:hypothetical protein